LNVLSFKLALSKQPILIIPSSPPLGPSFSVTLKSGPSVCGLNKGYPVFDRPTPFCAHPPLGFFYLFFPSLPCATPISRKGLLSVPPPSFFFASNAPLPSKSLFFPRLGELLDGWFFPPTLQVGGTLLTSGELAPIYLQFFFFRPFFFTPPISFSSFLGFRLVFFMIWAPPTFPLKGKFFLGRQGGNVPPL